jgi:hypothetical protein
MFNELVTAEMPVDGSPVVHPEWAKLIQFETHLLLCVLKVRLARRD